MPIPEIGSAGSIAAGEHGLMDAFGAFVGPDKQRTERLCQKNEPAGPVQLKGSCFARELHPAPFIRKHRGVSNQEGK